MMRESILPDCWNSTRDTERYFKDASCPMEGGIVPVNTFDSKFNVVRFLRFPIEVGIHPRRLLELRSSPTTAPNNEFTPCHEEIGDEVFQPVMICQPCLLVAAKQVDQGTSLDGALLIDCGSGSHGCE